MPTSLGWPVTAFVVESRLLALAGETCVPTPLPPYLAVAVTILCSHLFTFIVWVVLEDPFSSAWSTFTHSLFSVWVNFPPQFLTWLAVSLPFYFSLNVASLGGFSWLPFEGNPCSFLLLFFTACIIGCDWAHLSCRKSGGGCSASSSFIRARERCSRSRCLRLSASVLYYGHAELQGSPSPVEIADTMPLHNRDSINVWGMND